MDKLKCSLYLIIECWSLHLDGVESVDDIERKIQELSERLFAWLSGVLFDGLFFLIVSTEFLDFFLGS